MQFITSVDDQEVIMNAAPKELIKKLMKISEYSHYLSFSFNPFDVDHILGWKTEEETSFFFNPERCHLLLKVDNMPEFEEQVSKEYGDPDDYMESLLRRDLEHTQLYMCAMCDLEKYEVKLWVGAYTDIKDGDLIPVKVPEDLLEYKRECCLKNDEKIQKNRRGERMEITVGMWEYLQKLLKKQNREIHKLKKKITW